MTNRPSSNPLNEKRNENQNAKFLPFLFILLAAGKKGTNVHPELNCLKFLKKDKLKNFEKMFARQSAWLLLLVSTSTTLFILLA
jgi:hypothetical protein